MWDDNYEKLFIEKVNYAQQKYMLHQKARAYFYKWELFFQIQMIILSAIIGTGNFLTGYFTNAKTVLIVIMGFVAYYISILTSLYKYFKISQNVELHTSSQIYWRKLFDEIKNQLELAIDNREDVKMFYDLIISEYNRLEEISPIVPYSIIKEFIYETRKSNPKFTFNKYNNIETNTSNTSNTSPIMKREEEMITFSSHRENQNLPFGNINDNHRESVLSTDTTNNSDNTVIVHN